MWYTNVVVIIHWPRKQGLLLYSVGIFVARSSRLDKSPPGVDHEDFSFLLLELKVTPSLWSWYRRSAAASEGSLSGSKNRMTCTP